MKQIIEWSKGNPGALNFLMNVYGPETSLSDAALIQKKLEQCMSIRGTNLYVLYSDLCNKDMALVIKLCKMCPNNILEDACNRQDYSGIKLIEEYLK